MRRLIGCLCITVLLAAGCGGAPRSDELAPGGAKGDSPLLAERDGAPREGQIGMLGTISYHETVDVAYTPSPPYRALSFSGEAGDVVLVNISSNGSGLLPMIWLLDERYGRVAKSQDDELAANYATLGPLELSASGTFYIVFRERAFNSAQLSVGLSSANRTPKMVLDGCPGQWTDGATAGRSSDLDFGTIAGAYTLTARGDFPSAPLSQTSWPLPTQLTLQASGSYDAVMELAGSRSVEQGNYAATNNLMFGPMLVLQPGGAPPSDDRSLLRVLGLDAPGGTITRLCLAQLAGPSGRVFTLERTVP